MAVLKKDELFAQIHSVLGKMEAEESVTFLENMTDTYNRMEELANGDGEDWKQKYEENDAAWRKRYTERFLHNPSINNYSSDGNSFEPEQTEEEKAESIRFNDLFK